MYKRFWLCATFIVAAVCCTPLVLMADPSPAKVDILFVGAHPDDESTAFGTMARAVLDRNCRAAVVTATRGEGGGNAVGHQQGASLGILRELEEREALRTIGIRDVFYLDKVDGGFTTSAAAAEAAWGHQSPLEKLVRYYRVLQPDVVITMNPWPVGHGHHQFMARLATEAFFEAGQSSAFPSQLSQEHLSVWRPKKLYYALEYGEGGVQSDARVDLSEVSPSQGLSYAQLKRQALRAYRTQGWDDADEGIPSTHGFEPFMRALSRVPVSDAAETDIMAGIRTPPVGLELTMRPSRYNVVGGTFEPVEVQVENHSATALFAARVSLSTPPEWASVPDSDAVDVAPGQSHRWRLSVPIPLHGTVEVATQLTAVMRWKDGEAVARCPIQVTPDLTCEVAPIGSWKDFRRWARRFGLEVMVHGMQPEVALGSGEAGTIPLLVQNHGDRPATVQVGLACPALHLAPPPRQVNVAPNSVQQVVVHVQVPAAVDYGSFPLLTVLRQGEVTQSSQARLEVVPTLSVPSVSNAMPLDGNLARYRNSPSHLIPHDRLWSGSTSGAADLTGRFWLVHDRDNLYFAIDVTDDVVVSNIAPDDNQGHWRTDSVELAFDPRGPGVSPTTLSTFKVGIIPFNTAGHPMAARDADAHPGPVPLKLYSHRTDHGYILEAVIPMSQAIQHSKTFGFNVMLYDADKKDARVGENAGHARTAWSAWEDVQGTPRLWGHASLR